MKRCEKCGRLLLRKRKKIKGKLYCIKCAAEVLCDYYYGEKEEENGKKAGF